MSLLEKAKEIPTRDKSVKWKAQVTDEMIELILAWFNNEITTTQMVKASGGKNVPSGNYLYRVAIIVKEALRIGKIEIVNKIKKEETVNVPVIKGIQDAPTNENGDISISATLTSGNVEGSNKVI